MKNIIKIAVSSLFCVSLHASALQSDLPVICGHETQGIQSQSIYSVLNYGLYWFNDQVNNQVPTSYCDQAQSRFFDSTKQHTMVFVHGFSPFSVMSNSRFNFNANDISGPAVSDLVAPWLAGSSGDHLPWNVGVFYWNQFADEQPMIYSILGLLKATQVAEAKIWSTTGPDGMRWRDNKNILHNDDSINQNIADIFVAQYIAELKDYAVQNPNADIRLVGESLGTQLVTRAAKLIADEVNNPGNHLPKNLIPDQVVLLDPVVTKDDNGDETRLNTLISNIQALEQQDGVVFSGYRTSDLGDQAGVSDNTKLLTLTAFSDFTPSGCVYPGASMAATKNQHTFGIWWYLLSYTFANVPVSDQPGISAPFANMPINVLKQLMIGPQKFISDNATANQKGECLSDQASITKEWSSWQMNIANKTDPR